MRRITALRERVFDSAPPPHRAVHSPPLGEVPFRNAHIQSDVSLNIY